MVLLGCYYGITRDLLWYYWDVTMVLLGSYYDITGVLLWYY